MTHKTRSALLEALSDGTDRDILDILSALDILQRTALLSAFLAVQHSTDRAAHTGKRKHNHRKDIATRSASTETRARILVARNVLKGAF